MFELTQAALSFSGAIVLGSVILMLVDAWQG